MPGPLSGVSVFGRVPFGRGQAGGTSDPLVIAVQIAFVASALVVGLSLALTALQLWQVSSLMGVAAVTALPNTGATTSATSRGGGGGDGTSSLRALDSSKGVYYTLSETTAALLVAANPTTATLVHQNLYLTAATLFDPLAVGAASSPAAAETMYAIGHVAAALLMAIPTAVCVERRKYVLDYVATAYLVFIVTASIVTMRVLHSWVFFASVGVGFAVAFVATAQVAYRREMSEILVTREDDNQQQQPQQQGSSNGTQNNSPHNSTSNNNTFNVVGPAMSADPNNNKRTSPSSASAALTASSSAAVQLRSTSSTSAGGLPLGGTTTTATTTTTTTTTAVGAGTECIIDMNTAGNASQGQDTSTDARSAAATLSNLLVSIGNIRPGK